MRTKAAANNGRWAVFVAVAALLGALICFIGAAAEAAALGRPHRLSTPVMVLTAAAFAAAAIVLVRLAVEFEHRSRTARPSVPPAADVLHPASARHPKNGPVARMIAVAYAIALLVFLIFVSVDLHAKAARSAYTQHHGLPRAGTVRAVHSVDHSTRSGSWTTYNYDVALVTRAGGTNQTVLHDPAKDFQRFALGEPLTALVDLESPAYAELPDHPVESSSWYVGPLIIAVLFTGFASLITYEEIQHRRRRAVVTREPAHSVRI